MARAAIGSILAAAAPQRVSRLVAIKALGALADNEDHTAQRLRESVAARRALAGKRLRVFADIDSAVRARMQASELDRAVARLLVERGLRPVDGGHAWSSDPRLTITTALRWRTDRAAGRPPPAHGAASGSGRGDRRLPVG